jgi:hypothetical protein
MQTTSPQKRISHYVSTLVMAPKCSHHSLSQYFWKDMPYTQPQLLFLLPIYAVSPSTLPPGYIWHLPFATPVEDISDGLVELGFDVISAKQMSATRRSLAEGTSTVSLPLFITTLQRTSKSQENFKLTSLCHVASLPSLH